MKITNIQPTDEVAQRLRPNFISIEKYGTMVPLPGEIGNICTRDDNGQPLDVVERIFIMQPT